MELLRRVHVEHLRSHMEIFYEHGSTIDILALCSAFDLLDRGWQESANCSREQATLIEAFLAILGLSPQRLLESGVQLRPNWPI
ncbi:MAG: hypothetical protein WB992_02425 [Bryobacteraceae bacterium]